MDEIRFDALTRTLTRPSDRRGALLGLVGEALLAFTVARDDAEAHNNWSRCKNIPNKKKRDQCEKKGKEHKVWHKSHACRGIGKKCGSRPCCDGLACRSGRCSRGDVLGGRSGNPGGVWVTPVANNFTIEGTTVYFQARAYPEKQGDPRIDYVEFTGRTPGGPWKSLCRDYYPPVSTNRYACVANIDALGFSNGSITVSFDVYDTGGNHTLAPHGMRPGMVANSTGFCQCVEFIKNTFGLVDALSVRGSRTEHATDMGLYLQEQGWVKESTPRSGGNTIAIIDKAMPGWDPVSGHVALVDSFQDQGGSWRLTLKGANQTGGAAHSTSQRCSNVNLINTTVSKSTSLVSYWHNPHRAN